MYQKIKEEKARADAERAKYDKLRNKNRRGEKDSTPEVFRKPVDIKDDPRYAGQTTFMLEWVPQKCRDEKTLVDEASLRDWILFAMIEEDPGARRYHDDMDKINLLIDSIDANLLKIPKLEFLDEDGKPYPIEKARAERENLYNILSSQRVVAEEDMELAEKNLENHINWRRTMGIELIKGDEDKNTDTCIWFVRFYGTDDCKEMEQLLMEKEDWPGINLACGVPSADPPIKPWVSREKVIPDGSKSKDAVDYTPLQVNISGARIQRIPAGVGMIQQLDRESSNIYGDEFGVFYGTFEAGRKSGYGIEIDDVGVFAGSYEEGGKRGRGRLDLADGTTITGPFSAKLARKTPECKAFINPYKEGELNGQVEVYYGDGAYFKGTMENGRINGQGDYQSAMNEVQSGTFLDGVLHGPKGFIENQIGEVFMGNFFHGELHGKGTYQHPRGDSYEGYWQHNMRHGRGVSYYVRSGCYRGFYINNLKHGKGSLEFGFSKNRYLGKNAQIKKETAAKSDKDGGSKSPEKGKPGAKEAPAEHGTAGKDAKDKTKEGEKEKGKADESDPALEKELSEFNNMFQGFFFGNGISNRGSVMNTRLQMPNIISRHDHRATAGIMKVLKREDRQQKAAVHAVERFNDIECHIRDEIQKKKIKIYNQQKHFAKKTMYSADMGELGQGAGRMFESKVHLRTERLHGITEDNHKFKKAVIPRLRVPNNSTNEVLRKAFGRIRPERGEVEREEMVDEKLLKLILSDFEEVQERQRFLKYDRIWARAEEAYIGHRSAAV